MHNFFWIFFCSCSLLEEFQCTEPIEFLFSCCVCVLDIQVHCDFDPWNFFIIYDTNEFCCWHERSSWNEWRKKFIADREVFDKIDSFWDWTASRDVTGLHKLTQNEFEYWMISEASHDVAGANTDIGMMQIFSLYFFEVSNMQDNWIIDVLQHFSTNIYNHFVVTFLQLNLEVHDVFVVLQIAVFDVDFIASLNSLAWWCPRECRGGRQNNVNL